MKRAAIIGGGAAGLCCAVALARGGFAVTLFEQNDRVGKKLLSTGNGRCNLTNLNAAPGCYTSPDFAAPALTRYPPEKVLSFFESLSLFTHADAEGRVYPLSNQASSVLDALRLECTRLGVRIKTGVTVTDVSPAGDGWRVEGERFDFAVLACGGKAAVKSCNGLDLLRSIGIPVTTTAPGLVKLTTSDPAAKQLKGVRAAVRLTLRDKNTALMAEEGELLFGDGVLSGIAAMNLSSAVNREMMHGRKTFSVVADFVPSMAKDVLRARLDAIVNSAQRETAEHLLSGFLPRAIGLVLLKKAGVAANRATASLTVRELDVLTNLCKGCVFPVTGTRSYPDAQVMLGGADCTAFDNETMEANRRRHFFCIGEVLDVDAPCGGFNLQWAFASALLCADAIVKEVRHASHQ
ncbi:MAG: aminoacetone oxidase family FAD-binding enzyme [Clostridia bacterium]|nr:aminoacetone oxidase family FAD-binding enzyme [Clostridia bacterium]